MVVVGGRWKSQIRKIVSLSPDVEKPFNSRVIKSFVPELRSRKVFRVSGFLCYLHMSYEHSMSISRIHVWLCNSATQNQLTMCKQMNFGLSKYVINEQFFYKSNLIYV